MNNEEREKKNKDVLEGNKRYYYYNDKYYDALSNPSNIDEKFTKIYDNIKFTYANKEYDSDSIYIVTCDGSVHLVDADNSKFDLLTGSDLSKKKNISKFIDSSVFYNLYKSGVINSYVINLDSSYVNLISNWDGLEHDKSPKTYAKKVASLAYDEKFGNKN